MASGATLAVIASDRRICSTGYSVSEDTGAITSAARFPGVMLPN
jgi:hypothetical protein